MDPGAAQVGGSRPVLGYRGAIKEGLPPGQSSLEGFGSDDASAAVKGSAGAGGCLWQWGHPQGCRGALR